MRELKRLPCHSHARFGKREKKLERTGKATIHAATRHTNPRTGKSRCLLTQNVVSVIDALLDGILFNTTPLFPHPNSPARRLRGA